MSELEIAVSYPCGDAGNRPAGAVLRCKGEIDLASVRQLRKMLRAVAGRGVSRLEIDLREVYYLDSAGIGVLLHIHQELKEAGGTLTVLVPSRILALLHLVGLEQILSIVPVRDG